MSLLSVNQLLVVISTESLAVIHQSRGFATKVLDQKHLHFPQVNEVLTPDLLIWQPAIKQLDSLLASMNLTPKTQIKMILASDFVRYLSLPAQQLNMSQEEKLAYAAAAYREVYGTVVDSWQIKMNDSAPRQPSVASAVDKALLDALHQLANKNQLNLVSIQPYLMSAFNALSSQMKGVTGYLVIIELSRILLVSLEIGECQNLRVFLLNANWQNELKSILTRELLMAEKSNSKLFIYAPTQKSVEFEVLKDWQFKRLNTKNTSLKHQHMAMLEAAL